MCEKSISFVSVFVIICPFFQIILALCHINLKMGILYHMSNLGFYPVAFSTVKKSWVSGYKSKNYKSQKYQKPGNHYDLSNYHHDVTTGLSSAQSFMLILYLILESGRVSYLTNNLEIKKNLDDDQQIEHLTQIWNVPTKYVPKCRRYEGSSRCRFLMI